jgi:hypothetical protein
MGNKNMSTSMSAVATKNAGKNAEANSVPLTQEHLAKLTFSSFQSDQLRSVLTGKPELIDTKLPTLHLRELKVHTAGSSVAWQMLSETRNYFGKNPRIDTDTGQIRFDTYEGVTVTLTPITPLQ